MAGRQVFEIRLRLSPCHLFALNAMADFSPPPLFSPTNTESDEANAEGVTIIHGEVSCPVVDFEIVPCHIHVCVDPDPDTATATSPPLPDHKPGNWVQSRSSLVDASSFSVSFVCSRRISNQTSLRVLIQHVPQTAAIPQAASQRNLYEPRTLSSTPAHSLFLSSAAAKYRTKRRFRFRSSTYLRRRRYRKQQASATCMNLELSHRPTMPHS